MKRSPLLYPCYFRGCKFQGYNLAHHFELKQHQLSQKVAKLHQSFFTRKVNFLTEVSKVKQNDPVMCAKCHLFFDRIDIHSHNNHQLRKKSQELASQLTKSITITNNFIEDFERKTEPDSTGLNKKTKEYDNLDQEKQKKQTKSQTKKKTISQKKDKDQKTEPRMGKSSSTEIRLQGRYAETAVEEREREQITILKNKLPLTKAKKIDYGLPSTTALKFH